jgi:hypothetical protein
MGARHKYRFVSSSSQDGLNCRTNAGIVIDDENSRRRFNEAGRLLRVVKP